MCRSLNEALPFTHGHRKLGPYKKDRTSYFPVRPSNPVNKSLMLYNSNLDHPSQFYPRVSKSFFCSEVENSELSENLKTPENINCEKFVYQHRYYSYRYRHHVNNLLKNTQTDFRIYKHLLHCVHHMYPYSPHRENMYSATLNFNLYLNKEVVSLPTLMIKIFQFCCSSYEVNLSE